MPQAKWAWTIKKWWKFICTDTFMPLKMNLFPKNPKLNRKQKLCVQWYSLKKKIKKRKNQPLEIKTVFQVENVSDIILNEIKPNANSLHDDNHGKISMQIASCKWPLPGRAYGKVKTGVDKRGKSAGDTSSEKPETKQIRSWRVGSWRGWRQGPQRGGACGAPCCLRDWPGKSCKCTSLSFPAFPNTGTQQDPVGPS